jgi:hypothetical protein
MFFGGILVAHAPSHTPEKIAVEHSKRRELWTETKLAMRADAQ